MKHLVLLFLCVLFTGCVGTKSTSSVSASEENKLILPPDVPSNKYSKTRQANKN